MCGGVFIVSLFVYSFWLTPINKVRHRTIHVNVSREVYEPKFTRINFFPKRLETQIMKRVVKIDGKEREVEYPRRIGYELVKEVCTILDVRNI